MALIREVIAGTYEEYVLGYEFRKVDDQAFDLSMKIASHVHQGSVRCVATHGHYLASSGADELVLIFNLIENTHVTTLSSHEGTVTCLAFVPDGSHLISASQDGCINIARCKDWCVVKTFKNTHRNGVVGLSVHPSSKLMLTIGADNILIAWNLIKGRHAYSVNNSKKVSPGRTLNLVTWSNTGSHFAVCIGDTLEVFATDNAALTYNVQMNSKISSIDFWGDYIFVGREDGVIGWLDVEKKATLLEKGDHDSRVKCAKVFVKDKINFLVTADSQGHIKVWQWVTEPDRSFILKCEVNAGCRITCLALVNPGDWAKKATSSEAINLEDCQQENQKVESRTSTVLSKTKNLNDSTEGKQTVEIRTPATVIGDQSDGSPITLPKSKQKNEHNGKRKLDFSNSKLKWEVTESPYSRNKLSNTVNAKRLKKKKCISTSKWEVENKN